MNQLFAAILGWIGNCIAIVFFISPVFQFIELIQGKRKVEECPFIALMINILQNSSQVGKALRMNQLQSWVCNLIGGIFTVIWLSIWIIYYTKFTFLPTLFWYFIMLEMFLVIFYVFYTMIPQLAAQWICMIINIGMCAGPCENLLTVVRTGNYTLIPIVTSILNLANSFCWFIYGLGQNDFSIYVPNIIGMALGAIQIAFWAIYRAKAGGHWDPEEHKEGNENAGAEEKAAEA
jgi:solute carrier family 50 protein (sugar transporter)